MPSAFANISKIPFEGPKSRNPLAFRHYQAEEIVEGKSMREHLRFSVVYWHTFRNRLTDPFGAGTAIRPWDDGSESVENALEVTHELGGDGYVFWGGREGYSTLWNTDMKRELDHLARFLHMAVDYKKEIGFKGQFYIEPKPKEPTKHQYDSDAAACLNFLRQYDLIDHLKLNVG